MKRREGRVVRQDRRADRRADLRRSAHGGLARPPEAGRRRRRRPETPAGHVIPLEYRLRPGVRVESCGRRQLARGVRAAAQRRFVSTRPPRDCWSALAAASPSAGWPPTSPFPRTSAWSVCESFRRRGILEVAPRRTADAATPSVSVIVPTRDRASELADCLAALADLEYPAGLLEVIVVDDGSADPGAVARRGGGARRACCWSTRATAVRPARATARRERPPATSSPSSTATASPRPAGCGRSRRTSPGGAWARWRAARWATTTRRDSTATRRSRRRWTWERACSSRRKGRTACTRPPAICSCGAPCTASSADCARSCAWARTWTSAGACASAATCSCTRRRASCATSTSTGSRRCSAAARTTAVRRPRLHALHPDKRGRLRLPPASAATVALVSAAVVTRRPWLLAAALAPAGAGTRRAAPRRLRRNGVAGPGRAGPVLHAARPPVGAVLRVLPAGALLPLAAGGRRGRRARRVAAGGARRRLRRRRRLHDGAGRASACPTYLGFYVAEHAAYQTGVIAGHLGARLGRAPAVAPRAWSVEGTEAGMRT